MPRIRTIKPEFPQSESIGKLSRDARLLFIQIWTIVDDSGRTRASSRMLASLLYPYDDDVPGLMDGWLAELEKGAQIRRYSVDGCSYLEVCNWLKHQKIDKPSASRLPEFVEGSRILSEPSRILAPDLVPSTLDLVPSTEDQKPSRKRAPIEPKPTSKTAVKDSLHAQFKEALGSYWKSKNTTEMPWDGAEGKALGMFQSASPDVTLEQFTGFLRNRFKSEVNHGDRPSMWIRNLTSYQSGPLDRFSLPLGMNGHKPEARKIQVTLPRSAQVTK